MIAYYTTANTLMDVLKMFISEVHSKLKSKVTEHKIVLY